MLDGVMDVVRRDVDRQLDLVVRELFDLGRHRPGIEPPCSVRRVDVDTAIRARRTHKQYGSEPVSEAVVARAASTSHGGRRTTS